MLYTIGYQRKSFVDFLHILKSYEINLVIDVRKYAVSKNVDFNKNNLRLRLAINKILYMHKPQMGAFGISVDNYCVIRADILYQLALSKLIENIDKYKIVLMCYENNANHCHRKNLISADILDVLCTDIFHL